MKTSHPIRRPSAFTLIELLVVITIIGILASMAFPVVTGVMEKGRKVRTLAVIKDLQVAIKGYQTEYNRYPSNQTGSDTEVDTRSELIQILMGSESQSKLNGRGISFIDLPMAKNGRGGLIGQGDSSYQLVDEWSNPFQVIMDTSGDGKVKNPDTENEDSNVSSGASPQLPSGAAIYSFGPDGAPPKSKRSPSKDDITSWRS